MFIGHFGLALACKKLSPKTSLGVFFFAAQFLDLLWPLFLLTGLEQVQIDPGNTVFTPLNFKHYPFSHSLFMAMVWGLLACVVYLARRENLKTAGLVFVLVVSHWFLDVIVHRPDLPVVFGDDIYAGFGLWNSLWGTILVELFLFLAGLWLYVKSTNAADKTGKYAPAGLAAFLILVWLGGAFGPPPSGETVVALVTLGLWPVVFAAHWMDRHRVSVQPRSLR